MRWVRKAATRAACGAAAAWLSGCASLPAPPADLPVLSGRMALNVAATPQALAQSLNAGFELSGDAARGQLRLISPIGTQLALARWDAAGAELDSGEGPRRYADLPTLSRETLGEEVPLAALGHWLAGKPWPGSPSQPTAEGFSQLGWQVDLARFAGDALVVARRDTPPAVVLRAKLDR
jgi:outer membrane lipoprotein LolB